MKETWIISDVCVDIDSDDEMPAIALPIKVYCKEEDIDDEVSNAIGYAIHWCTYEMEEDNYYRFPIPSWAICYLVNGDPSGLSDEDFELVREFDEKFRVVDVAEQSYFEPFPHFGLACDCYMCACEKHS